MSKSFYKDYLKLLGDVPDFLIKYLSTPSLLRLKSIGYFCGMDYASKDIYDFKEKISRFDHSLTVSLLVWKFTKDKKMAIAGLFHDIGTPCFSHVIDYMNKDYENQESTEEFTEEIIKNDKVLLKYLEEDNISYEDIVNFKKYSIVDTDRPKLCADRIDGIILTGGLWTKVIDTDEVASIISDLEIYKEDNHKELGFKSLDIARRVLEISDKIDIYCHSNEDNYMMELLASITRKAISNGLISYSDLYYLDELTLLDMFRNSNIPEIKELLYKFENVKIEDIPKTTLENVKSRNIDPLVRGKRLSEYRK